MAECRKCGGKLELLLPATDPGERDLYYCTDCGQPYLRQRPTETYAPALLNGGK